MADSTPEFAAWCRGIREDTRARLELVEQVEVVDELVMDETPLALRACRVRNMFTTSRAAKDGNSWRGSTAVAAGPPRRMIRARRVAGVD